MKQTAVEWLEQNIWEHIEYKPVTQLRVIREQFKQAKVMEKEQIIDAHIEGQRVFDDYQHTQWTNDQAELYYNETFNTKNE